MVTDAEVRGSRATDGVRRRDGRKEAQKAQKSDTSTCDRLMMNGGRI
jgi:hypothetical protein